MCVESFVQIYWTPLFSKTSLSFFHLSMCITFYQIRPRHPLLHYYYLRNQSDLSKATLLWCWNFSKLTIAMRRHSVTLKGLIFPKKKKLFYVYKKAVSFPYPLNVLKCPLRAYKTLDCNKNIFYFFLRRSVKKNL